MPDYSRFFKRMKAAEAARGPDEKRRVEKFRRAIERPAEPIDTSKIAKRSDRPANPKLPPVSDRSTLH